MEDLEMIDVALSLLLVGASVTAFAVAASALTRYRRGERVRSFRRVVHRPLLWAVTLVCGGASGLLLATREVLPSSWQGPGRSISLVFQAAFIILMVTQGVVEERAKRASDGESTASE